MATAAKIRDLQAWRFDRFGPRRRSSALDHLADARDLSDEILERRNGVIALVQHRRDTTDACEHGREQIEHSLVGIGAVAGSVIHLAVVAGIARIAAAVVAQPRIVTGAIAVELDQRRAGIVSGFGAGDDERESESEKGHRGSSEAPHPTQPIDADQRRADRAS